MIEDNEATSRDLNRVLHNNLLISGQNTFMRKGVRWGLSIPMAAIITLGLAVTMTALIAVEFVPQEKNQPLQASINPVVEDIKPDTRIEAPKLMKDIEMPPPPPTTGSTEATSVIVEPVTVENVELDFDFKKSKILQNVTLNIDSDYQPILRVPPAMPRRADRSGHCNVRFDVSPQGHPFNIEAIYCSQTLFSRNTVKSVAKWKFRPKMQNGQPVTVKGVENTVLFQLTDERGNIIPE